MYGSAYAVWALLDSSQKFGTYDFGVLKYPSQDEASIAEFSKLDLRVVASFNLSLLCGQAGYRVGPLLVNEVKLNSHCLIVSFLLKRLYTEVRELDLNGYHSLNIVCEGE